MFGGKIHIPPLQRAALDPHTFTSSQLQKTSTTELISCIGDPTVGHEKRWDAVIILRSRQKTEEECRLLLELVRKSTKSVQGRLQSTTICFSRSHELTSGKYAAIALQNEVTNHSWLKELQIEELRAYHYPDRIARATLVCSQNSDPDIQNRLISNIILKDPALTMLSITALTGLSSENIGSAFLTGLSLLFHNKKYELASYLLDRLGLYCPSHQPLQELLVQLEENISEIILRERLAGNAVPPEIIQLQKLTQRARHPTFSPSQDREARNVSLNSWGTILAWPEYQVNDSTLESAVYKQDPAIEMFRALRPQLFQRYLERSLAEELSAIHNEPENTRRAQRIVAQLYNDRFSLALWDAYITILPYAAPYCIDQLLVPFTDSFALFQQANPSPLQIAALTQHAPYAFTLEGNHSYITGLTRDVDFLNTPERLHRYHHFMERTRHASKASPSASHQAFIALEREGLSEQEYRRKFLLLENALANGWRVDATYEQYTKLEQGGAPTTILNAVRSSLSTHVREDDRDQQSALPLLFELYATACRPADRAFLSSLLSQTGSTITENPDVARQLKAIFQRTPSLEVVHWTAYAAYITDALNRGVNIEAIIKCGHDIKRPDWDAAAQKFTEAARHHLPLEDFDTDDLGANCPLDLFVYFAKVADRNHELTSPSVHRDYSIRMTYKEYVRAGVSAAQLPPIDTVIMLDSSRSMIAAIRWPAMKIRIQDATSKLSPEIQQTLRTINAQHHLDDNPSLADTYLTTINNLTIAEARHYQLERPWFTFTNIPASANAAAHLHAISLHLLDLRALRILTADTNATDAEIAFAEDHLSRTRKAGPQPYPRKLKDGTENPLAAETYAHTMEVMRGVLDIHHGANSLQADAERIGNDDIAHLAQFGIDVGRACFILNAQNKNLPPGRGISIKGFHTERIFPQDFSSGDPLKATQDRIPWAAHELSIFSALEITYVRQGVVLSFRNCPDYSIKDWGHLSIFVSNSHFNGHPYQVAELIPTEQLLSAFEAGAIPALDYTGPSPTLPDINYEAAFLRDPMRRTIQLGWGANYGGLCHAFPPGSAPYHQWEKTLSNGHTRDAWGHFHLSHITGTYLSTTTFAQETLLKPLQEAEQEIYRIASSYLRAFNLVRIALSRWHKNQTLSVQQTDEEAVLVVDPDESEVSRSNSVGTRMLERAYKYHQQYGEHGATPDREKARVLRPAFVFDYLSLPPATFELDSYTMRLKIGDEHTIQLPHQTNEKEIPSGAISLWQEHVTPHLAPDDIDPRFFSRAYLEGI